jgi:hypothetical protein
MLKEKATDRGKRGQRSFAELLQSSNGPTGRLGDLSP